MPRTAIVAGAASADRAVSATLTVASKATVAPILHRVEVNQRALIDKILARYATANAVYRELLQNSNDANAAQARIEFSTATNSGVVVSQVVYRNNGVCFRPQDWQRLAKIAEGNPDPSKIGAFGVGAYTMFAVCEQPRVISGAQCLEFVWQNDALYYQLTENSSTNASLSEWTSFELKSRDPYPLPDWSQFGQFLCASLTFTQRLQRVQVSVDGTIVLDIAKTCIDGPHALTQAPPGVGTGSSNGGSTSWWPVLTRKNTLGSSTGMFTLDAQDLEECTFRFTVTYHDAAKSSTSSSASLDCRYVQGVANTHVPSHVLSRMQRVTKKDPPATVPIQLFWQTSSSSTKKKDVPGKILAALTPGMGQGKIFIGFATSQTTGLAWHVAAPFLPTVEREAMDLQDTALRQFNLELLETAGLLLRWALQHAFGQLDQAWQARSAERAHLETQFRARQHADREHTEHKTTKTEKEGHNDESTVATNKNSSNSGVMGFARFMARGVTKSIVSAVQAVATTTDPGAELLEPPDPMPLHPEEEQAIMLMRSFCPRQSTPDVQVGTALAQGFGRAYPDHQTPPVLTRLGVVAGRDARLPHQGLERFCQQQHVTRKVVWMNAREYFEILAQTPALDLNDLLHELERRVLTQDDAVMLMQWWTRFRRVDATATDRWGLMIKERLQFRVGSETAAAANPVTLVRNWLFYVDRHSILAGTSLPLPDTVVPPALAERIGWESLHDPGLQPWFDALSIEVWADFMCQLDAMTKGKVEEENVRVEVLLVLSREFSRRSKGERAVFGSFCQSLLADKRCIPFDSDLPSNVAADRPGDLYLYSSELRAFEGAGTFYKASNSLKSVGVTEEFLLALGVRKSVSVDFLFSHLDTLSWSKDPRPLIDYLRSATLTNSDMEKLRETRYLPIDGDERTYAPAELFLPNPSYNIFPFVKMIKWPTEAEVSETSENGKFLVRLGVKVRPALRDVLTFASGDRNVKNNEQRIDVLDFICERMGPHGPYQPEYSRMPGSLRAKFSILPCLSTSALRTGAETVELRSPVACFVEEACATMGFATIDPKLGDRRKLYGSLFQCDQSPITSELLASLLNFVGVAKRMLAKDTSDELTKHVAGAFARIFDYLAHRSSDFTLSELQSIKNEEFIPVRGEKGIVWCRADQAFFNNTSGEADALTQDLFHVVDFNAFLATAGVKQEASTKDIFKKLLTDAKGVLDTLGDEKKYRILLRRIAANPPFTNVTNEIAGAPFLLAYNVNASNGGTGAVRADSFVLSRASDIYIIDNTFFGRMFSVKRAPPESDLEDFYALLGSQYISKSVDRRYEVAGKPASDTPLTLALQERVLERSPLLISPSVTTRPLVSDAATILDAKRLAFLQASHIMAIYSLSGTTRRVKTTCCSRQMSGSLGIGKKHAIFIVDEFDWFDVGYAIGDLILKRAQLEDAFFISSLLEAPLDQLRARGFPVDRILPPEPVPAPKPAPTLPTPPPPVVNDATSQASRVRESRNAESSTTSNDAMPPSTHRSPDTTPSADEEPKSTPQTDESVPTPDGFVNILKQMFPDADESFLRQAIGPNPDLNDVRSLAEQMAQGHYPKSDNASTAPTEASEMSGSPADASPRKKKGLRSKFGKAFNGLRGSSFGGVPAPVGGITGGGLSQLPVASAGSNHRTEQAGPVSPAQDAQSQSNLERMLENTVGQSSQVNRMGGTSQDTILTSIPEELNRGPTCELVPGHSLEPFAGVQGNGKTSNGILLFASGNDTISKTFMTNNRESIDAFAVVLEGLAEVFGLKMSSIAIFHDPGGGTIAFNSNRALHYNLRFFHALHFMQHQHLSKACYAYWYVTTAHELAHHMVSAHNKEHGFYTESYVAHYLPKLMDLIGTL